MYIFIELGHLYESNKVHVSYETVGRKKFLTGTKSVKDAAKYDRRMTVTDNAKK